MEDERYITHRETKLNTQYSLGNSEEQISGGKAKGPKYFYGKQKPLNFEVLNIH